MVDVPERRGRRHDELRMIDPCPLDAIVDAEWDLQCDGHEHRGARKRERNSIQPTTNSAAGRRLILGEEARVDRGPIVASG